MKLKVSFFAFLLASASAYSDENTKSEHEKDPSQEKWIKAYAKHKALAPEEMLLNTDKEPETSKGFTPLFNGKDLTNWKHLGGAHKFEIKEGNIIEGTCVPGQQSAYLSTTKDYKNFIFTCELKWLEDMNTGFLFRSKEGTERGKPTAIGPQAEMEGGSKPGRGWSGGVYLQGCGGWIYPLWLKQHKQARTAQNMEVWNRVPILAQGETIKIWVNGIPTTRWKDTKFHKGFISLQVHSGKKGKVQFKNPKIKELTEKGDSK